MAVPEYSSPSLHTRSSLLHRLRDWEDATTWEEFYHLYRKVLHDLAIRAGLDESEAQEVVQDVFKHVAQNISDFESRSRQGAFRRWLINQARWRITDRLRAQGRAPGGKRAASATFTREGPTHTRTIERVPDVNDADSFWESEWQQTLLEGALQRLARRVPAKHFQVFDLYVRQGWTARRVAREFGVSTPAVYLIGHRLTKQLRGEVERLRQALE